MTTGLLFVWLLLTAAAAATVTSSQLTVARGFFTFIQPTDVTFRRSSTATQCKISVDLTDLSTLQVGTVQPHVSTHFITLSFTSLSRLIN